MEHLIFPLILITAGAYFLIKNISMFGNDEKIRSYLENSAKGKLWINKMGIKKTLSLTKKVFLPFGIVAAISMLGFGLFTLWQLLR